MAEDWSQYETKAPAKTQARGGIFDIPRGKAIATPQEEIDIAVAKKEALAGVGEGKETEVSSGEKFRVAKFKLIQSSMLFDRMNQWNEENLGPLWKATDLPGLKWGKGAINKIFGEKLKENPWVETFVGDQNTTAMEFVRAIMPTRAARLVEMVKESLPTIGSTEQIKDNQLKASLVSAIGSHYAQNPEDYPEIDENVEGSLAAFITMKEKEMSKLLGDAKKEARMISGAQSETGILMISPSGEIEDIPMNLFTEAASDGYKPVSDKQKKQLER